MKKILLVVLCTISLMANDIIIKDSNYDVPQTVQNIKNIVVKKGLTVFSIVNHQANAKGVGMKMREAQVIVFGNPNIGTKMMQENILVGLDLPMKVLVYRDSANSVKVAYRNGSWLKETHELKNQKIASTVDGALGKITDKATK